MKAVEATLVLLLRWWISRLSCLGEGGEDFVGSDPRTQGLGFRIPGSSFWGCFKRTFGGAQCSCYRLDSESLLQKGCRGAASKLIPLEHPQDFPLAQWALVARPPKNPTNGTSQYSPSFPNVVLGLIFGMSIFGDPLGGLGSLFSTTICMSTFSCRRFTCALPMTYTHVYIYVYMRGCQNYGSFLGYPKY